MLLGTDKVPGGIRRALWAGWGWVVKEGFMEEVILGLECRVE